VTENDTMTYSRSNFLKWKNTTAGQDFAAKSREYVLQTTADPFTSDWNAADADRKHKVIERKTK
jgi:hypothetical protein